VFFCRFFSVRLVRPLQKLNVCVDVISGRLDILIIVCFSCSHFGWQSGPTLAPNWSGLKIGQIYASKGVVDGVMTRVALWFPSTRIQSTLLFVGFAKTP
jgi:hypothetical protein